MAFTTHDEYIDSNKSEKIVLAHLHGSKRLYNFVADSGVYSKTTPHFVNAVKKVTTSLIKVDTLVELDDDTKFFYDVNLSKLYLFDFDQDLDEVIVEYRFFFSNVPMNLSWDLTDDDGEQVEYEPRIIKVPLFKSQMSQGKKGLNLVGKGAFQINNNDGFYDDIYDTIFFENKDANIYSFNRDLVPTDAKQIFRGIVTGKTYATSSITFGVNDSLYKLDEAVITNQYGDEVSLDDAQNYKRTIYGKSDNVLCQSLDQYGEGIAITGTITGVKGEESIIGTGTSFISELSEGDQLIFSDFTVNVEKVKSDTIIIVNELQRTFSSETPLLLPQVEYKDKNRQFQVANHALKQVATTITAITSRNRIIVDDPEGFEAGDTISIDGEIKEIRRISENTIVLNTNYNLEHSVSDPVTKREIFNVRYGEEENAIEDQYITIDNTSIGSKFTIAADAEINSSAYIRIKENFSFFSGLTTVWLGTPAIYNIGVVGNSGGHLYEKYFIIYDEEDRSTAFWFKDSAPLESSAYSEPNHGADEGIPVSLAMDNMTVEEVRDTTIDVILAELDFLQGRGLGSNMAFESVQGMVLTNPNAGTALFYPSIIQVGDKPVADIDFTKLMNPRDYIKLGNADAEYEILSVQTKSITIRTAYAEADTIGYLKYKNVNYITDDTKVYVDCFGKTKDGEPSGDFIKTGPEVVQDILTDIGLGDFLDTDSFDDAIVRAPQTISVKIPMDFTGAPGTAKDIINDINQTLIGSLYINTDLDLGYDILDSEVPLNTLRTIGEEDLIKWSVKSDGFDLSKTVIGKYKHLDYDPSKGEESNSEVTYTSEFVEKYIGNENTNVVDLLLYNESDAQEMIEREQFINSLSNSTIKVSGKLALAKFNLGERVLLDFNRLYVALGSTSNTKRVGIITSMNNTGEKVGIEIEDMGALYSRSARITDESADDYADAGAEERVLNSYITDDNDIIDDDEDSFSTNLIS